MTAKKLAQEIVQAAADVKAEEPQILDLRGMNSITDYFVIAHGRSDRQVQAIADRILENLAKKGLKPLGIEGYEGGHWVLVDYGDVVAHLFYEETRRFYDLESLWNDAPRIPITLAVKELAP